MNMKKSLVIFGTTMIIAFIAWFYIGQLRLPDAVSEEKTIASQVINTESKKNAQDEGVEFSLQRIDSQGTVVIQATLLPEKSKSNLLVFEIAMNTHSGDLLQYEIENLAELSFGSNTNTSGTFEWELVNEDSHHMMGYLTWNGDVLDDRITLNLNNIENIPSREFIWEKSDLAKRAQTDKWEEEIKWRK